MNFKQFGINLGNAIKNFALSFKVIDKDQYENLIAMVLANEDKVGEYLDANKDNTIQCSELIAAIKKAIKKGD